MLQLHNNGSLIKRIFSLHEKFLHLYSTSTSSTTKESTQSLAEHLVNSLGFSDEEATAISGKVSRRHTLQNSNLVVNFFKEHGLDDAQIKKIVSLRPKVLSANVENVLKPKVRVFQNLGLSGSDLGDFLVHCIPLLSRNLGAHIVPVIDFLTSILGENEDVIRAVKGSYWGFDCDLAAKNINLLRNCGVSHLSLRNFVAKKPAILRVHPDKVQDACVMVTEKLRIPVESPIFLRAILALAAGKIERLESRSEVYKSFGWSDADISTMTSKRPECLTLSDCLIRSKLEYYMKGLGLEAEYIASHPSFLTYSLEKRVFPRVGVMQVLKDEGFIKESTRFYQGLTINKAEFVRHYLLPYKKDLPDLYEAYVNKKMDSFVRSC